MQKETFLQIHKNTTDWWLETKSKIILEILKKYFPNKKVSILDVGSGTGFLANYLNLNNYSNITVSDKSKTALKLLKKQFNSVLQIDLPKKPDTKKKFDCILLLDVMEHINDDYTTLENLKKLLKPNGKIIVTVPAFEFLWSKKDIRVEHKRRYSLSTLKRVFSHSNFKTLYITYYNFLLFLPAILYTLINKKDEKISRYKAMPHSIFKYIFQLEIPFIIKLKKFPFGVSLLAVITHDK